jgi:hypothetical protein
MENCSGSICNIHILKQVSARIFQFPDIYIPYLTPTWLLSLRQFLLMHNMSVTVVSDSYQIPLLSGSDEYIMQHIHLARYSTTQQRDISLVRICLQVNTLVADITDKKCWSDDVWDTLNLQMFGQQYCRLTSRQRITRTKFVHDQLPLVDRRFQQSSVKDPLLSLCPCCKATVEDTITCFASEFVRIEHPTSKP